jgi:hypothetical protein
MPCREVTYLGAFLVAASLFGLAAAVALTAHPPVYRPAA